MVSQAEDSHPASGLCRKESWLPVIRWSLSQTHFFLLLPFSPQIKARSWVCESPFGKAAYQYSGGSQSIQRSLPPRERGLFYGIWEQSGKTEVNVWRSLSTPEGRDARVKYQPSWGYFTRSKEKLLLLKLCEWRSLCSQTAQCSGFEPQAENPCKCYTMLPRLFAALC